MRKALELLWRAAASRFPALYWLRRGRTYYQNRQETDNEQRLHAEVIGLVTGYAPRRLLEYGVGNAAFLRKLHAALPAAECHGVDISRTMLRSARATFPEAHFAVSDLTSLAYPDDHFDVVVGLGVLIYLPPHVRERVFRELRRVMKGHLIAVEYITKYFDDELLARFRRAQDLRYTYDIEAALRAAGFRILAARKVASTWDPRINTLNEMPHGLVIAAKR